MVIVSPRLLNKDQGMNAEQIKTVEKEIGYEFEDKQLLIQAYTRRSFSNENPGELHNEVLETIGDAVLSHCVLQRFLKEYGTRTERGMSVNKNEGELTILRSKVVQKGSLADAALKNNLADPEYFRLGKGERSQQGYDRQSVQEGLLESIIGAVAADCNFDNKTLYEVSLRLTDLKKYIDTAFTGTPQNYIGDLQEYYQRRGLGLPQYDCNEQDKDGEWICRLKFGDKTFEKTGHNKQEATSNVAHAVLETIENQPKIPICMQRAEQNPINMLQELCQKGCISSTRYKESGSAEQGWSCSASIDGIGMGDATAANKKAAKMQAAERLYEIVKQTM